MSINVFIEDSDTLKSTNCLIFGYVAVCTGFLLYLGQKAYFIDYTNTDTNEWVGFVDPKN